MIETIAAGAIGFAGRIVPEIIKLFGAKSERAHELAMLNAEMEFAKIRGDIAMKQTEAAMTMTELQAITEMNKEQGETARAAGGWVLTLSASVRPVIAYWYMTLYTIVKATALWLAVEQSPEQWKELLVAAWTDDDFAIFVMIISFFFAGRVFDRVKNGSR
jgi:hypothetical protein